MASEIITVVGAGEVGRVFARVAPARVVKRGEAIPGERPIVACVREDDLAALVPSLIPHAGNVVLVQNGWIDEVAAPLLDAGATRGLLWFTAKGDFFEVLAPSLFHGPRASLIESILGAGGVAAREVASADDFAAEVAIKLAWNNVVGLPLAVHGVDLEAYLRDHAEEARAIVEETCAACGVAAVSEEAWQRLLATTSKLVQAKRAASGASEGRQDGLAPPLTGQGQVRGGKKSVAFRNGAVVRLGALRGVPTPVNEKLVLSLPAGPA